MSLIRLGMIGISEGNGHPYSWSAIFNGYDPVAMENCGFPTIPRYLEKQNFPKNTIAEARVTHVWTQDKQITEHIAKTTFIETVVERSTDMIGHVDGVLLARDDAEKHCEFAAPFLNAGIPLYIDKPLALTVAEARRLFDLQKYPGQIFSCSSLRYAKELQLSHSDRTKIGRLRHIHATVPKDWNKYSVHIIEPMLLIIKEQGIIEQARTWQNGDSTNLVVNFSSGLHVLISAMGSSHAPLAMRVMGDSGWKDLIFQDVYSAFRSALYDFVQSIIQKNMPIDPAFMLEVVNLVELGKAR